MGETYYTSKKYYLLYLSNRDEHSIIYFYRMKVKPHIDSFFLIKDIGENTQTEGPSSRRKTQTSLVHSVS